MLRHCSGHAPALLKPTPDWHQLLILGRCPSLSLGDGNDKTIKGKDLSTYNGWISAAEALLESAPDWTAIVDEASHGFIVKAEVDGTIHVFGLAKASDSNIYNFEDGVEFDWNAWNEKDKCWEGTDMKSNIAILENPLFIALNHA